MNKVLSTILTGILGIIPGTGLAQQQQTLEDRIKVINPIIETEIRKWGPWVERYIESDYTDGRRTKPLAIFLRENDKLLMSLDYATRAAYNPNDNSIGLEETVDPKEVPAFQKDIGHEIFHYVLGKNGLLNSSQYSGPTRETVLQHASEAMALPENQKVLQLEEQLQFAFIHYRAVKQRFEAIARLDNWILETEKTAIEVITETVKELENKGIYNREDLREDLGKIYGGYQNTFAPKIIYVDKQLDNILVKFEDDQETTLKRVQVLGDEVIELEKIMGESYAKDMLGHINGLERLQVLFKFLNTYEKGAGEKLESMLSELDQAMDEVERSNNTLLEGYLVVIDRTNQLIASNQPKLIENNIRYFRNPEEFAARAIARVVTLDYSSTSSFDNPFVTDAMLEDFNQIRDNGQRVLGDRVDRFLVGRELVKMGHDPSAIPTILEGTLGITVGGKRYIFRPGNNYRIVGVPAVEAKPN